MQVVHHGDKPAEVTPTSFRRFLCDSPLRHAGPELYPEGVCVCGCVVEQVGLMRVLWRRVVRWGHRCATFGLCA